MAGYALPTTGLSEGDDGAPPSTAGQVWDAAVKAQRDVANPQSRAIVLDDEYDKAIARVQQATGVRLFHPRRDRPTDADYAAAAEDIDHHWYAPFARPDEGQAMAAAERRFHLELDKLRQQNPDKAAELSGGTVWDAAYERVRRAEQASEETTRRSPLTASLPLLGDVNPVAMAGSFWGWAHDPLNLATALIGPEGSAAKGILWNAARQAAAGAAQQAAVEPFVQSWRREAGLDYGWSQAAMNVAMGGVFGGAVDAAGRSIYRGARGRPLGGTPEPIVPKPANDVAPGAAPADMAAPGAMSAPEGATRNVDTALEAGARKLPPEHPVRRAAQGEPAALIELGEKLGAHAEEPAAVRAALDQFRHDTLQEASIAEAIAAADVEDRLAAHIRHVADPDANPPGGAPLLVAPSGADTAPGAAMTAAPGDAAVRALREGDLHPVEAATLLRERPELAGEVSAATETGKGIHALTRLSDPAFARVAAGDIDPALAAIVADAAPAARHADMLERLVAAKPRDAATARRLVAEMLQAPTDAATARMILEGSDALDGSTRAGAVSAPEARTKAPEFDEPHGDGAKLQAESLKGLEERAAGIEDLKLSLRGWFQKDRPLGRYRAEGVLGPEDLPGALSRQEPPPAGEFQMFHATNRNFERFDMTKSQDFGVHFGTADQAAGRIKATNRAENARTIPVTVDVTNAIVMKDPGYWGPKEMSRALQKGGFNLEAAEWDALHQADLAIEKADSAGQPAVTRKVVNEANAKIAEILNRLGIDGIWYRNEAEGSGWSLLVWNKGQVRNAITGDRMMRLADGGSLADTAYAPAFRARETAIGAELAAAAERTLPRGVALEVADRLRVGAYELDGYFDRRNNILAVALDSGDPAFTFNHERIHALKAHGLFSDAEWGLLVAEAGKRGLRQEMGRDALEHYRTQLTPAMVKETLGAKGIDVSSLPWAEIEPMLVKAKLLDPKDVRGSLGRHGLWDEARLQSMIDEEAVAFLAEGYRAGETLPAGVAGLMQRVEAFLERVRNVLAGHGFQTLDDLFHRIETGEVADRSAPLRRELEAATADADASALVQACKLF